jgi:hypothetical protein
MHNINFSRILWVYLIKLCVFHRNFTWIYSRIYQQALIELSQNLLLSFMSSVLSKRDVGTLR